MKVVVDNVVFSYDDGIRILKSKLKESPDIDSLKEMWDDIKPLTFSEIASMRNLEQRRIALLYLGIDAVVKDANPKLEDKHTIKKTTYWIGEDGELIEHKFDDTYCLYSIDNAVLGAAGNNSVGSIGTVSGRHHFVKFKDTSTDREYMIWVDMRSVANTNNLDSVSKVDSIHAIAWTIQTDVRQDNIEQIVRQGDCIMVKPKNPYLKHLEMARHLTKEEYLQLIVAES